VYDGSFIYGTRGTALAASPLSQNLDIRYLAEEDNQQIANTNETYQTIATGAIDFSQNDPNVSHMEKQLLTLELSARAPKWKGMDGSIVTLSWWNDGDVSHKHSVDLKFYGPAVQHNVVQCKGGVSAEANVGDLFNFEVKSKYAGHVIVIDELRATAMAIAHRPTAYDGITTAQSTETVG
jgi:hypothetical protein